MTLPWSTRALHPAFGAELLGFPLRERYGPAEAGALRDALDQHSVLLIRGLEPDDARQVALARALGPLEPVRSGLAGTPASLIVLSNVGADGRVVPESATAAMNNAANRLWHSDSSFRRVPALASVLSARRIPESGGETEFVSTRVVWAAMPEALRARVRGQVAIHDLRYSRGRVDPALAATVDPAELPPVRQAMVRRHLPSGTAGLFIGSHVSGIEGMDDTTASALLQALTAFVDEPRFRYTHVWRPGDLLVWDNRFTLHRGRPFPAGVPRTLMRATVAGECSSLDEQV